MSARTQSFGANSVVRQRGPRFFATKSDFERLYGTRAGGSVMSGITSAIVVGTGWGNTYANTR